MKQSKYVKQQLKAAKRLRKFCQKNYPDWKDDEYNCGDLKFLWGLLKDRTAGSPPSFCTLNSATLYYSRLNRRYYLDIEVDNPKDFRASKEQLLQIFSCFQEWVVASNEPIYTYQFSDRLDFDLSGSTIGEIYAKFYIISFGFQTLYK